MKLKFTAIRLILSLFFFTSPSWASLPVMNIHFGGPLNDDCTLVDNDQVIAALSSSLDALSRVEDQRQECQHIYYNSRAFLDSYLNVLRDQSKEVAIVEANQRYIQDEVERLTLEGNYHGEFDDDLLALQKDLYMLQNEDINQNQALASTIEYGSLVVQELAEVKHCGKSFGKHVLSPALGFMSGMMGYISPVNVVSSSLIAQGLSFSSYLVSYLSDLSSDSYLALRDLTQSSNYHLSYKCTMENLEKMICGLEEEEHYAYNEYLGHLEDVLNDLDINHEFKEYFDLKRHSYRLSKIFDSLEAIYNSPETYDDQIKIVTYQSRVSKLGLAAKMPPLKNEAYIQLMIQEGLISDATGIETWSEWNQDEITFQKWWFSYIQSKHGGDDYLFGKVQYYCERFSDIPGVWSPTERTCYGFILYKPEEIKVFIGKVIAPALVDLQKEIKRLIGKVQRTANIQKLFTEIASQEVYSGHIDYSEYKLTELLDLLKRHSERFLQTPVYYLAKEVEAISVAIMRLAEAVKTPDRFATVASQVYSELANISNNGQGGQILYKGDLESKVVSYFDEVSRYYLLTEQQRAKRFAKYSTYKDMFEKFRKRLNLPDSQGSANLPLALDIRDSFLKVFKKPIARELKASIKRYKKQHIGKRELLHSCALFLPFMTRYNGFGSSKKFCTRLLQKEGGLPILINDSVHFPLYPHGRPNFKQRCYYYQYKREVLTQRAYRFRQRADFSKH